MNSAAKRQADKRFTEAYEACYLSLIKYCAARMGDARIQADDCVQEAFLVCCDRTRYANAEQTRRACDPRSTKSDGKRSEN